MIPKFLRDQLVMEALKRSVKMNFKSLTKTVRKKYDTSELKEKVDETKEDYDNSDIKTHVEKTMSKASKLKDSIIKNANEMGFGVKLRSTMSYEQLLQLTREGSLKVKEYQFYVEGNEPEDADKNFILSDGAILNLMKEKEYQNNNLKIKIK